jgi:hypothetical protein
LVLYVIDYEQRLLIPVPAPDARGREPLSVNGTLLRRLREAIIERREGTLRDDATALLIEWRRGSERKVVPETV